MKHLDSCEIKAQERVNQLQQEFIINQITAERLHEIHVFLFLAEANKNQRGIDIQQAAMQSVLRNCSIQNRLMSPVS